MAVDVLTWITPAGTSIPWDGTDGVYVLPGPSGRFMPPIRMVSEQVPLQHGDRFRQVTHGARRITVPLVVTGTTGAACRTRVRTLLAELDPVRGQGTLRSTINGQSRDTYVRYSGGAEGDERNVGLALTELPLIAEFIAHDPYDYDASETVTSWVTGTSATFFPFFPLVLSSSEIAVDATVTNDGDVESWPVWVITGPGSGPILRNVGTGAYLGFDLSLTVGESMTIDTTPGAKTVLRNDGASLFAYRLDGSSFWPLAVGANSVRLEMSGATGASGLQLNYRRRYLGT